MRAWEHWNHAVTRWRNMRTLQLHSRVGQHVLEAESGLEFRFMRELVGAVVRSGWEVMLYRDRVVAYARPVHAEAAPIALHDRYISNPQDLLDLHRMVDLLGGTENQKLQTWLLLASRGMTSPPEGQTLPENFIADTN